ncbi:MAG TPA: MFS transporter [Thermotoga sp.]|nr:MFS transporter [Thermotoga sp.]
MTWNEIPKSLKNYILLSAIGGFSFLTYIVAPALGSLLSFSLEDVGWIFSVSYAFQAVLTYILGKKFEKKSPNIALFFSRIIFAFGNILFAMTTKIITFILAQLIVSFTEIFYPSVVMYERAIFLPKYREKLYWFIFTFSDMVKVVIYSFFAFLLSPHLSGLSFYRTILIVIAISNIFYAFSFLLILPRVRSGSDFHEEHVQKLSDKKTFMFLMIHQYLAYTSFGIGSFMIITYYILEYFKLGQNFPIIFEIMFSISVVASLLWRPKLKTSSMFNLIFGSFLLSFSFFLMCIPNVYLFFSTHFIMGIAFVLWFPGKESVKMEIAPKELGRWEGFFQGLNIFTKIFTPALSAIIATKLGYFYVFFISGFLVLVSSIFLIPVFLKYKNC